MVFRSHRSFYLEYLLKRNILLGDYWLLKNAIAFQLCFIHRIHSSSKISDLILMFNECELKYYRTVGVIKTVPFVYTLVFTLVIEYLFLVQGLSRKRYFRRKGLLFCEKRRTQEIEGKMVWFGLCWSSKVYTVEVDRP